MDKFLIIGLGSMGKRRARCLNQLGKKQVFGFDTRPDRIKEASNLGVEIIDNVFEFIKKEKPVCIISVPPDRHLDYMKMCVENGCHFFVEASVILDGMEEFEADLNKSNIVGAPSCTMLFHPAIRLLKEVIQTKNFGKVSSVVYHSGQYLPDWHPYEKVSDFYVSNKATGGCREIVPFELTWMGKVFGLPKEVKGLFGKTIEINGASEIDDTYSIVYRTPEGALITVVVDVVSRVATRNLTVNFEDAQLRWDWNDDYLEIFSPNTSIAEKLSFKKTASHDGYNSNIGEGMYIDEVNSFLGEISGNKSYPTDMSYDVEILKVLNRVEQNK